MIEGIQPSQEKIHYYLVFTLTMAQLKHKVMINVDLGEGYGNFKCGPDEELIPFIDHANIACGFHAG